jgi:hypothetical protein
MGVIHQECVLGEEITIGQFGPMTTNALPVPLRRVTRQHFLGAWVADTLIRTPSDNSNREFVQVDFLYQLEVK